MNRPNAALNGICPYFTMFPVEFPLRVLSHAEGTSDRVLDPFCGRGTTNIAARLRGMNSVGIDSHPLAIALTEAKLVSTSPGRILEALDRILEGSPQHEEIPEGEFWTLAYEESTLRALARVRGDLLRDCRSAARIGLRAILLGALHGPVTKGTPSYLSNQCTRTYAPKPQYAVSYWRKNGLLPRKVDIRDLVARRARRFYLSALPRTRSKAILGDSRNVDVFRNGLDMPPFDWVITSPPYYGLRTYRPDQWLRLWFLGGPGNVDYSQHDQLTHGSPESFARQLSQVWRKLRPRLPGRRAHGHKIRAHYGSASGPPGDSRFLA